MECTVCLQVVQDAMPIVGAVTCAYKTSCQRALEFGVNLKSTLICLFISTYKQNPPPADQGLIALFSITLIYIVTYRHVYIRASIRIEYCLSILNIKRKYIKVYKIASFTTSAVISIRKIYPIIYSRV